MERGTQSQGDLPLDKDTHEIGIIEAGVAVVDAVRLQKFDRLADIACRAFFASMNDGPEAGIMTGAKEVDEAGGRVTCSPQM